MNIKDLLKLMADGYIHRAKLAEYKEDYVLESLYKEAAGDLREAASIINSVEKAEAGL
ncbi:hypothetical protein [Sphingobium sp. CFD-1]|uniref:hypothetical protein n=1 Tax=Sphingobium sp. CFD-1 TaxID=2878545 RepID=UPI00214BC46A|nr:hypothetical protein [Sphingobium sp. CFD-1]